MSYEVDGVKNAVDKIGSALFRRFKMGFGSEGSVTDVSNSYPLPVAVAQDLISRGLTAEGGQWNKFGYRDLNASAGGEQTLWAANENHVIMESAETFTINYNNATDGAGTNGALQVTIFYVDASGVEQIYAHTLGASGSEEITLMGTGLGINRAVVTASGSAKTNVNDITIDSTSSGNLQAIMPALNGVTQQMIFFAASNKKALGKWLFLGAKKIDGGASPRVAFRGLVYARSIDCIFEVFRYRMDTSVENGRDFEDPCNFPLTPGDVLYFVFDTNTNNTQTEGRLSLNTYTI